MSAAAKRAITRPQALTNLFCYKILSINVLILSMVQLFPAPANLLETAPGGWVISWGSCRDCYRLVLASRQVLARAVGKPSKAIRESRLKGRSIAKSAPSAA